MKADNNFQEQFQKELKVKDQSLSDITYDWWVNNNHVKPATTQIPTKNFKRPERLGIMMFNRLYGQKDSQYSKLEWFPTLDCLINKETIFNWVDNLSTSLQAQVRNAHNSLPSFVQGFHMSAYLVDAICVFTPFPLMDWNFSNFLGPIRTYCSILWAIKFMDCFYHICYVTNNPRE